MYPVYSTRNAFIPTLFNEIFNEALKPARKSFSTPAINVSEDDKEYKVEFAAPGMTKDDFNIQLTAEGNMLVKMEKKNEVSEEKKDDEKKEMTYHRHEFSYSQFEQTFTLPEDINKEAITASMTDGILTIDLPKVTEEKAPEAKFIEIK